MRVAQVTSPPTGGNSQPSVWISWDALPSRFLGLLQSPLWPCPTQRLRVHRVARSPLAANQPNADPTPTNANLPCADDNESEGAASPPGSKRSRASRVRVTNRVE